MERIFDPWQQEAIAISGGRHLVLAPPGCGKTDILTERVVHAHASGVEYRDMLCLTFTNRAAKGMAQRIADRTGNPVPDELFVGNIHRFCSQVLFTEGVVNHNSAIIDEGDVDNIVQEELCIKLQVKSRSTELMRFQHALRQAVLGTDDALILHNELLHTSATIRLCDVLGMPRTNTSLAYIYTHVDELSARYSVMHEIPVVHSMRLARAYEQYKEENDLLDYDDLLVLAYEHLKANREHGRYRWIEIDEVQDLNALQFAIVDQLATDDATIVYLGDDQQAIFSFIGAKLETLEQIKQRCRGHIHHLYCNYRSPRYLLDLQNDYAVRNLHISRDLLPTTDSATAKEKQDLCLLNVDDGRLQAYYTARFAQRYGQTDPDGRVAILVSTNHEADEVSDTMTALGIEHFKISGTDLFSLPSVRMLLAHLCVLNDESVFIAWARIFWSLKVLPTYTEARSFMREVRSMALLPTDFLEWPNSSYVQQMVHLYDDEEIVIFDTETTGLDPTTDDIIQIAAIRVRQGRQVGRPFNIILETDRELPATVGGHPNPMIEVYGKGPRQPRAEGLRRFIEYCGGCALVGHNVGYDYRILQHNLQRECPDLDLAALCPRHFDTLKYIRLVRPRLRHYKLVNLIESLHLEGVNSHRADDDIMATLSLLQYCHRIGMQIVTRQSLFIDEHRKILDKFTERYRDIHQHGTDTLRREAGSIIEELEYAYRQLLADKRIDAIEKWSHLIHFLDADLIRSDLYPTLGRQLERYTGAMCTLKEADLCGNSLKEHFIISTVHKAKGLEFDTVIVYRAIDGNYPASRSWTEKDIQEDARKLFVALSRSRRRLCVTCDNRVGTSVHSLSPFLQKVEEHFTHYHRGADGRISEG